MLRALLLLLAAWAIAPAQCVVEPSTIPPPVIPIATPPPQNVWTFVFDSSHAVTQIPSTGGSFDFYQNSTGNWDAYFLHSVSAPISGTLTLNVSVSETGSPTFIWYPEISNTCLTPPASAHPFFTSAASGADGNEYHRWWAKSVSYVLGASGTALVIPLTPGNWSDVYGHSGDESAQTLAGFTDALNTARWIGLTLGGGCFFGHGVNVSGGTATFTVSSYTIQ
jgi:hypothetical protein